MDAATSGRSTRNRAAVADATSGLSGELIPVLMRIPDVRPPARGKAKRETVALAVKEIAVNEPAAPPAPAAVESPSVSDTYKPAFELSYPSDAAKEKTVHLESPVREIPVRETELAAPVEKAVERVVDSAVTAAKENPSAPDELSELPIPAANDSTGQPSSNRRQRQRRPAAEPTKTSWWRTQGRALAAVFVIGLSVTIYFSVSQRGTTPDTAHEDEAAEGVDITPLVAADDDHDENHDHDHVPHVASKPRTTAPALTEQPPLDDEPLHHPDAGLDEAEDVDPRFADAEEATHDVESDMTSTDEIDFGDLPDPSEIPDHYRETDPETYRDGGRVPRTANTPNSSSSR